MPIQRVEPAAYRVWFEADEEKKKGGLRFIALKPCAACISLCVVTHILTLLLPFAAHQDGKAPAPASAQSTGGYLDLLYDVPLMIKQLEGEYVHGVPPL